MAAIILGQARAHPHGRASRGVPRDQAGPPPQLRSPVAPGRWPSTSVPTPRVKRRARAGWRTKVSPGGSPSSVPTPGAGEICGPGYRDRDQRRGRGGRCCPPASGRGPLRAHPPSPGFAPGQVAAPRVLRLRKPGEAARSALAANSSAVRPPSWACSVRPSRRRPPTRKLAPPGGGGEDAGGGEPASPAAPRQWQTSQRPQSSPGGDRYLINNIKSNPSLHPIPNHGGCGRRSAAVAGPCPLAGDQQVNCWGWGGRRSGGRGGGARDAGWLAAPAALIA